MLDRSLKVWTIAGLSMFVTLALLLVTPPAHAQSIIKRPGAHPDYIFEAEPHLIVRNRHWHEGNGFGPGFRGTVVILDQGFIPKLNNSVGIGFGIDMLLASGQHCHSNGRNAYCHDVPNQLVLPVVLQWNFWLHKRWSVFGEPGFAMIYGEHYHDNDLVHDNELAFDPFVFHAGGRFHFTDTITLTMRLGFPAQFSIGVSFLI